MTTDRTNAREEAVGRTWDRNAPRWVEDVRAGRDLLREVVNAPMFADFLPEMKGCSVLDLGCGEGTSSRALAGKGAHVTGIDLSQAFIAAAAEEERRSPLGITYYRESFTELRRFADDTFDRAVSFMALMDGPDFPQAMRAVHRVLKPGGTLHFNVLHPCFWRQGSRWVRGNDQRPLGMLVRTYWNETPYEDHWSFQAARRDPADHFQVPRFPLRMEQYVQGLIDAGFAITRMQEPRPTEEMAAALPLARAQREHVPMLVYFGARKA